MPKGIVHLVSSLQVGGAEKFVCALATEQHRQGQSVSVMSFGLPEEPFQQQLQQQGVPVINITGNLPARCLQLLRQLPKYQHLHIHSPAVIRALLPIWFMLLGRNCVYTIHGEVDPPQSLIKLSHQFARSYLRAISAVSVAACHSVQQRYGWPVHLVQRIDNGIAMPEKVESGKYERLRLGLVGRMIPLKNQALLLQAIQLLTPQEQAKLEIHWFGDGVLKSELQQKAQQLPDVPSHFHGNVQSEEAIYRAFDVLVICSDTEGLPMSLIEAMAYGKAVIATRVGAIDTLVAHDVEGWLYTAKDVQALARIIQHCQQQPASVTAAGRAGRQRVEQQYRIEHIAAKFQQLYAGEKHE